jgi:hypothetical protein
MSYNYTLRYRTFDQLLDAVRIDFTQYDLTNYIEPQQLIKVAKKVNYDLGLRIMQTKEALLEIEKGRVKLPDNFYVLNFALICDAGIDIVQAIPQGTNIQEVPYKETNPVISACTDGAVNCQKCQQPLPCTCGCTQTIPTACSSQNYDPLVPYGDSCTKPRVFMNCKGDCWELIQVVNLTTTRTYKRLIPIKILENPETIDCDCPNLYMDAVNTGWIQNGYLYTNFDCGKVYINYQGMMEDGDNNLLVPDHDMINEYYEYAIKRRILENLIMNDESVSKAKIDLIMEGYRTSRNYALSIVNTPNFSEMKRLWQANRKAQYAKYYNMFKSGNLFLGWNTNYLGYRSIPGF